MSALLVMPFSPFTYLFIPFCLPFTFPLIKKAFSRRKYLHEKKLLSKKEL